MGAGKSTLGRVGRRAPRPRGPRPRRRDRGADRQTIADVLRRARRGRRSGKLEAQEIEFALAGREPAVLALGGGAVTTPAVRARARARRSSCSSTSTSRRPGGACAAATGRSRRTRRRSAALYEERRAALPRGRRRGRRDGDPDAVVLAAAGVHYERGALDRLGELVPGDGPVALVADAHVLGIHGARGAGRRSAARLQTSHELPAGEQAKQFARGRAALVASCGSTARGTVVALGGGCDDRRRRASPRRRTCAACRGSPCRRRSSARSTRRSAARPAIDIPRGQEPRRRVPLAGARRDRRDAARDAARARAPAGRWPSA